MKRSLRSALAFSLLLAPAIASDTGDLPASPSGLTAALQAIVEDDGAPGVAVLVYRDGGLVHQEVVGEIELDEPLLVASASKWVAAALIMIFVDEGRFSLDQPIALRMATGLPDAGQITLRQILSFTTGQGGIESLADLSQPADISLAESAALLLSRPLEDRPGMVFRYGSGAMQIAGALVEQVTGERWEDTFQERLAGPLGMTDSRWIHPLHPNLDPDAVTNPILQGGLITTAADYGRFLTMLADNGVYGGSRILSERAVNEMETLQTADAELAYGSIPRAKGWEWQIKGPDRRQRLPAGYALGSWCELADQAGRCLMVSSPGALGAWPWIDRESGIYGIFVMRHRFPRVAESLLAAREAILGNR